MQILHLSTSDTNGGAARAAFRQHLGLIEFGIDSKMFVRDRNFINNSVIRYQYPYGLSRAGYKFRKYRIESDFRKYQLTRPKGLETFSDDRTSLKYGFIKQLPEADIYNLHWLSGFVDLPLFFEKINKPIVWTLHDMFPFTGGCHYTYGCENFATYCHNCPQLGSSTEKDLSFKIWNRKLKAISQFKHKIVIRTDSHWLRAEAKRSFLFSDLNVETIHYSVETDEFIPRERASCRKALNIPVESKVVVFGAPGIENPRKGFKELTEALLQVKNSFSDLFLLSFGEGTLPAGSDIPGIHLGHITNNNILSIIYNCADVFVIPSLQEAFGQTALEAMSCEIPVVGFNTGGIPDMIVEGHTGYLASTGSIKDLAKVVNEVLSLPQDEYSKIGKNCRQKVLNEFTFSIQAEKYITTYKQLLNK